ncbi:MAG: Lrp/AsnC family transcriptional regulator [Desulfobacter sp.]|nr:MAG: Lrp/AsnC family transcriptional regulator [Desulfobacter sp.]
MKFDKLMDDIGEKILGALEADARISYSRLGKIAGLSTPAVTERVRKMEEAGIITGYHARVCREEEPPGVTAFIELDVPAAVYDRVKHTAEGLSQVLECHHISGKAAFILKVRVKAVPDLEDLVSRFSPFGRTRTSIVLSSSKEL